MRDVLHSVKQVTLRDFALVLFGISAIMSSFGWFLETHGRENEEQRDAQEEAQLRGVIQDLNRELDCRYELGQEVRTLQEQRDAAFAEGLIASTTGDEAGLEAAANIVLQVNQQLVPAQERAASARAIC